MKNKGIGAYLLLTFLGAWGLWLIGWVAASRVFRISPTNLLFQFVLLPGAVESESTARFTSEPWSK
jgi:hypothetical protein